MTPLNQLKHIEKLILANDEVLHDEINANIEWYLGISEEPICTGMIEYTKSIDAQAAIMPEGYHLTVEQQEDGFDVWLYGKKHNVNARDNDNCLIKKEELARLLTIVRVWIWEIENETS